jgi:hypothetical protein
MAASLCSKFCHVKDTNSTSFAFIQEKRGEGDNVNVLGKVRSQILQRPTFIDIV